MTSLKASPVRIVVDFADEDGSPRRRAFADPEDILVARDIDEIPLVLHAALAASRRGRWVFGWVAYEAAPSFDPALVVHADPPSVPLAWFAIFREPVDPEDTRMRRSLPGSAAHDAWTADLSAAEYTDRVHVLQAAIAAGETYQVNFTRRLTCRKSDIDGASAFAFYERMRVGAPFASFIDTGDREILSASPELFFRLRGREITTRPMKGTAPRGRWPAEDDARATALRASDKERAENVMIVDLLRNDLGRIAEFGSVHVPSLFAVERYPTVLQMTSTVRATLRPQVDLVDIFGALFPCGSITGAPKVQTMRHIAAQETGPRGVYCGAIGLLHPGGESVDFAVAIRTAVRESATGQIVYGVGGGITADSLAEAEWRETIAKSAVLARGGAPPEPPFDLLETLLLRDGAYHLRTRHLDRLRDSARFFARPADSDAVSSALDAFASLHPNGEWRVRLLVDPDGRVTTGGVTLGLLPPTPLLVTIAPSPVSRDDITLFHKTTRRGVYDRARAAMPPGIFDTLLWNEEGEATEFTYGNLIVEDGDAQRWTPARDCGLLAGTLRAELLDSGMLQERPITLEEVRGGGLRLFFANGVRGLVPVRLSPG